MTEVEVERLKACRQRRERLETFAAIFEQYRRRLRQMADLRLHNLLRGRVAPSDVVQEAYLEASRRLDGFLKDPRLPFFLWLRRATAYALHEIHDRHLRTKRRDPRRELPRRREPAATTGAILDQLSAKTALPGENLLRQESRQAVERTLDRLDPLDREILTLRFFEGLSSAEAALLLGVEKEAARKRYHRALKRFKDAFGPPSGEKR